MGLPAPRPSLPVTTWNEIRYQDMNAPARMTTGWRWSGEKDWPEPGPACRAVNRSSGAIPGTFGLPARPSASDFTGSSLAALDRRRLDPRRYLGTCVSRARLLIVAAVQRARPRHGTRHQHLRGALMAEIAIGEAHARNRAAERAIVTLVEIEARLERKTLDGSTNGLTANLQRIAGQAHIADRARAAELDGTGGT